MVPLASVWRVGVVVVDLGPKYTRWRLDWRNRVVQSKTPTGAWAGGRDPEDIFSHQINFWCIVFCVTLLPLSFFVVFCVIVFPMIPP